MDSERAHRILVVNPGSTTTRVALFTEDVLEREATLPSPDQAEVAALWDEFPLRLMAVREQVREWEASLADLSAVVGRGGLLRPVEGGAYEVNEAMLTDARADLQGVHPSNLGCALARALADEGTRTRKEMPPEGESDPVRAFIVDPVATDEFGELARLSGLKEIPRRSLSHALSIHALVRKVCRRSRRDLDSSRFVVGHLGGGISVCPVLGGRIIDANNANSGGPFSPSRSGGLPVQELLDLAFSGGRDRRDLSLLTLKRGGLMSYLGTDDAREVESLIEEGNQEALLVFETMAYQISKEIGGMATVLSGRDDGIRMTGGLATSRRLTDWIRQRVAFIAPVEVWPEVEEMRALAEGALRVLRGDEKAKRYAWREESGGPRNDEGKKGEPA